MSLTSLLLLPALLHAPVELRGGGIVDAPIEQVSAIGVRVGGDEPRVIGWDHVRTVKGEHGARARDFADLSDDLWRARTRLARGDIEIATPLVESLYKRYADLGGPTGLVIAEGVVRCRLWRGDQSGALAPWLHALALRRSGVLLAGESAQGAMVSLSDEATGLIPALPPVWLDTPDVRDLAAAPRLQSGDGVVDALHELYAQAAADVAGLERQAAPALPDEVRLHPGVALVSDMVTAMRGGERADDAIERLDDGLEDDLASWREAWRRAAIGRALVEDTDEKERLRGVIALLHLPARFASTQPYLAGVCEAEASAELREMGREDAADVIMSGLRAREPRHPVLVRVDPTPTTDNQTEPTPTKEEDQTP